MSEWFDGQFEEGDARKLAGDLLRKAAKEGFDEASSKKMADAYGDMCDMVLAKLKQLFEDKNPMTPLVIQYLSKPMSFEETTEKLSEYYKCHTSFMDLMMTLLMIRTVEYVGNVKNPFSVNFKEGTTSHVK